LIYQRIRAAEELGRSDEHPLVPSDEKSLDTPDQTAETEPAGIR
jgi:hypothetical protein